MRKIEFKKSMFDGNFIREGEPVFIKRKGYSNKTRRRTVVLECFNCKKEFTLDASNALRTKQKCCSLTCHRKLVEDFPGGNEKHPLYTRWLAMRQRCLNKEAINYKDYGERGIIIEPYLQEFKNYVDYVSKLPNYNLSLTIDRIDVNGNYERGNLRWATYNTQVANQNPNSRGYNKYTGVNWSKTHNRWIALVVYEGKYLLSKRCLTEKEALEARNAFLKANPELPHNIQIYSS